MLGYPEQMQKPVSINTCKTISSLRTVMPRLNISIPQALPTTQSLTDEASYKTKLKKHPTTTAPPLPPLQKVYILQVCGFIFLFLGELINITHVFGYNTWRVQASFTCA